MKSIIVLTILANGLLYAQDGGDWQGILKYGKSEERVVITIAKGSDGGWTASESTPDDGSNPVPSSSVIFDGSPIKIVFDAIRATYDGRLNNARNSFKGSLTQGSPLPFDLDRATGESSWRRDRTSHTIRFVAVENSVKLEVVDWEELAVR